MTDKDKALKPVGWFTISAGGAGHQILKMEGQTLTLCGRFTKLEPQPLKRGGQRCAMCVDKLKRNAGQPMRLSDFG